MIILPSFSEREIYRLHQGQCFAKSMKTPLDLDVRLEALYVCGYSQFIDFGMASVQNCVSCKNIMSALFHCIVRKSWEHHSGIFSHFVLSLSSFPLLVLYTLLDHLL